MRTAAVLVLALCASAAAARPSGMGEAVRERIGERVSEARGAVSEALGRASEAREAVSEALSFGDAVSDELAEASERVSEALERSVSSFGEPSDLSDELDEASERAFRGE